MARSGSSCWMWVALASLGCGRATETSSPESSPSGIADGTPQGGDGPGGTGDTPSDPAPNTEPESGEGETLPGPCREPAPPHLCLLLPGAREPDSYELSDNRLEYTRYLSAEVVAVGQGMLPPEVDRTACALEFGVEEGMARSGTHLEWVRLDVAGRAGLEPNLVGWLSVSAPPEGLPFAAGDTLEVVYAVVDDPLADFEPVSRSLVVRDAVEGTLYAWLATSVSVAGLNETAPPEVVLSEGAAQCEVVRTCPTLVQHELGVGVEGASLALAQGDLVSDNEWRVLAGQSEVMTNSSACTIDGSPQLASLAVWRLPD